MSDNMQTRALEQRTLPLAQLEGKVQEAYQALLADMGKSPADHMSDEEKLKEIGSDLKVTRDTFMTLSRELTLRLSEVGSMARSHEFRKQRTDILAEVFDQISDINKCLSDLHIEQISNTDVRSVLSNSEYQDSFYHDTCQASTLAGDLPGTTFTNTIAQSSSPATVFSISNPLFYSTPRGSSPLVHSHLSSIPPRPVFNPHSNPYIPSLINPSTISSAVQGVPMGPHLQSTPVVSQVQPGVNHPMSAASHFLSYLPSTIYTQSVPSSVCPPGFSAMPQNLSSHQQFPQQGVQPQAGFTNQFGPAPLAAAAPQAAAATQAAAAPQTFPVMNPAGSVGQFPAQHPAQAYNPSFSNIPLYSGFVNPISQSRSLSTAAASGLDPLSKHLLRADLIKENIEMFSGEAWKFQKWMKQINARTQNLDLTPDEILNVLASNSTGEPKKIIQNTLNLHAEATEDVLNRVLQSLEERFGSSLIASQQLLDQLNSLPPLSGNRESVAKGLTTLYDMCSVVCSYKLRNASFLCELDSPTGQGFLLGKLNDDILRKWQKKGHEFHSRNGHHPSFHVMTEFFGTLAQEYSNKSFYRPAQAATGSSGAKGKTPKSASALATEVSRVVASECPQASGAAPEKLEKWCSLHKSSKHSLVDCSAFFKLKFAKKMEIARKEGRCLVCLGRGHIQSNCKWSGKCSICSQRHVDNMHKIDGGSNSGSREQKKPSKPPPADKSAGDSSKSGEATVSCTSSEVSFVKSCSRTVPVELTMAGVRNKGIKCLCIIDEQSDTSFVDPSVMQFFGKECPLVDYQLTTMQGLRSQKVGHRVSGIMVRGLGGGGVHVLPDLLTCDGIPNTKRQVARREDVARHEHIAHLAPEFPDVDDSLDVLLLLGTDSGDLVGTECFGSKSPFAHRTPLGWAMVGQTSCSETEDLGSSVVNRCTVDSDEHFTAGLTFGHVGRASSGVAALGGIEHLDSPRVSTCLFTRGCAGDIQTSLPENDQAFSIFDVYPDDNEPGLSQNDRKFLNLMKDNVCKTEDNFLQLPLPLKDNLSLPENKLSIYNRTFNSVNNMKRKPEKLAGCLDVMRQSIELGYVEQITEKVDEKPREGSWYLPLHAVQHKVKKKYRMVFDASAKFRNTSLNDCLYGGPDLLTQLRAVLLRFRENPVAFVSDIEGMFTMFKVPMNQWRYLKFFWFDKNDPTKDLRVYNAKYHIFGAKSSPSVCNWGLKYVTTVNEAEKFPKAVPFLSKGFYMDDGMSGADSVGDAIAILSDTRGLLQTFNIRLHKIVSNSKELLDFFPPSERAEGFTLDLDESSSSTRTLGIKWDASRDVFMLEVNLPNRDFTKRGILSVLGSLYDPIGIVNPIALQGRLLQRRLITPPDSEDPHDLKKYGWDDELPTEYRPEWDQWRMSLKALDKFTIPRCFVKPGMELSKQEVHVFCDASDVGLGFVCYMKSFYSDGTTDVTFLLGNSKLAPRNIRTTPRLELCAAVLAAQGLAWILSRLNRKIAASYLHSDSLVVLGYIRNCDRRFSKFVSRRVNIVMQLTTAHQWHYVPTDCNPGDIASRPHSCEDLSKSIWFSGPAFLKTACCADVLSEPQGFELPEVQDELVSLKTNVECSDKIPSDQGVVLRAIERSGTLARLIRCIMVILKLKHLIDRSRQRLGCSLAPRSPLSSEEEALSVCVKAAQDQAFSKEVSVLSGGKELPENNPITKLSPFLDFDNVVRVGGRLSRAKMTFSAKYPILLPTDHPLTTLVISKCHSNVGHSGRKLTHGAIISAGYHILRGQSVIRRFLDECVLCKKLRGSTMVQKMADLPADRIEQVPPFTNVGCDIMGPLYVHQGRSTRGSPAQKKVWAVVFCCLVIRCVHLELIDSMDTSSFVNCLRRFLALRGNCKVIRTDNGSNLVAARKELGCLNDCKISEELHMRGCKWILHPVGASHFSGATERLVGRTRRLLEKSILLAGPRGLSKDELATLLCEISSIINQTPLTDLSYHHPDDPVPLTPQMLLTLKESECSPDVESFSSQDLLAYGKARWRRVQFLASQFWKRWHAEYLFQLRKRHKWAKSKPCASVGDVVLIVEKNVPRNMWKTGIIDSVNISQDALVRSVQVRLASPDKSKKLITRAITDLVLLCPSVRHKC